ncbi:MAG: ribosome maturation factor RimP [Ruminococcaceae bacterium]|nr:ribosome maturation factor RimP [Oscillospiraceae bacterium]
MNYDEREWSPLSLIFAKEVILLAKEQKGKNIAEKADILLRPTVEGLGYILWDVEYKKEGSDYNLILTIDKEGVELTLDDCVAVTDAVNPILDEEDPIPDSYCLEVSSAGLERELKRPEHFEKYKGCEVSVSMFAPMELLPKAFEGTLKDYSDEGIVFTFNGNDVTVEKSKVASIKNIVDYAEIFKKDK